MSIRFLLALTASCCLTHRENRDRCAAKGIDEDVDSDSFEFLVVLLALGIGAPITDGFAQKKTVQSRSTREDGTTVKAHDGRPRPPTTRSTAPGHEAKPEKAAPAKTPPVVVKPPTQTVPAARQPAGSSIGQGAGRRPRNCAWRIRFFFNQIRDGACRRSLPPARNGISMNRSAAPVITAGVYTINIDQQWTPERGEPVGHYGLVETTLPLCVVTGRSC